MSQAADEAVPPSDPQQQLQPGTDHSVAASQWAYPAAQVQDWLTHKQSPPAQKLAFLTFDDGPSGVTTPQVLKVLQTEQVHATFFEITRQIGDFDANLVREQVATGNAVEIHSYSHNYHYLFPHRVADAAHVSCDLDWSQAVMKSVLGDGYQAHALRYPGGHMSWRGMAPADAVLADRGIAWVDWDALSGDADATLAHHTADDLTRNVQTTAARNAPGQPLVILSHDFYPNHVEVASLTAQIDNLKAQGYSFGIIN